MEKEKLYISDDKECRWGNVWCVKNAICCKDEKSGDEWQCRIISDNSVRLYITEDCNKGKSNYIVPSFVIDDDNNRYSVKELYIHSICKINWGTPSVYIPRDLDDVFIDPNPSAKALGDIRKPKTAISSQNLYFTWGMEEPKHFSAVDGTLYKHDAENKFSELVFYYETGDYSGRKSTPLKESLKTIRPGAFRLDRSNLGPDVIPQGVTKLCKDTFLDNAYNNLDIQGKMTEIEDGAFPLYATFIKLAINNHPSQLTIGTELRKQLAGYNRKGERNVKNLQFSPYENAHGKIVSPGVVELHQATSPYESVLVEDISSNANDGGRIVIDLSQLSKELTDKVVCLESVVSPWYYYGDKKLTLTKITILQVEGKEPLVSYLVYEPIDEVRKLIAESRE